jgi:hypothetical protein
MFFRLVPVVGNMGYLMSVVTWRKQPIGSALGRFPFPFSGVPISRRHPHAKARSFTRTAPFPFIAFKEKRPPSPSQQPGHRSAFDQNLSSSHLGYVPHLDDTGICPSLTPSGTNQMPSSLSHTNATPPLPPKPPFSHPNARAFPLSRPFRTAGLAHFRSHPTLRRPTAEPRRLAHLSAGPEVSRTPTKASRDALFRNARAIAQKAC